MVNRDKWVTLNLHRKVQIKTLFPVFLTFALIACAGPRGTKTEKLDYFATLEKEALAQISEKIPEVKKELEESVGYAVIEQRVLKVPIVGAGAGAGLVVEKATGK